METKDIERGKSGRESWPVCAEAVDGIAVERHEEEKDESRDELENRMTIFFFFLGGGRMWNSVCQAPTFS